MSRSTLIRDELYAILAKYELADVLGELGCVIVQLGFVGRGMQIASYGDEIARQSRDNLPTVEGCC
jgi:hypothetical protein